MQLGLYFSYEQDAWIDCVIVNQNLIESRGEVLIAIGNEVFWTKMSRIYIGRYVVEA